VSETIIDVIKIYEGSNGDATKALYDELTRIGPVGVIATNLFLAQKNSARAKVYRGGLRGKGSFRGMAYDRKQWAMDNLAKALSEHAEAAGIQWGWGIDEAQAKHNAVLYIDIPTGQVSFHTGARGDGPEYPGVWDGVRGASVDRVCRWCARLLEGK
jgi:hypothetical protein